jgi:uncharacterized protein with ParB-like and HNH nuclease domain/predicted transport protein
MHAQAKQLIEIISSQTQFLIPIYQRTYSWTEKECKCLWDDILRAGRSSHIPSHFIGSVVYVLDESNGLGSIHKAVVIDGQQRITTILLMLKAISDQMGDIGYGEFSSAMIRDVYLSNRYGKPEYRSKLVLTQSDKETFEAIVENKPFPSVVSSSVLAMYQYICRLVTTLSNPKDFFHGLVKLRLVDISLGTQDNPQLIFESLNSTGKPLGQADLIRNFLLMGLPKEFQDELYTGYWRKLEQLFADTRQKDFDVFMRHYLLYKTKQPLKIGNIYARFKNHVYATDDGSENIHRKIVSDIYRFAVFYCNMAYSMEPEKQLRDAFDDLMTLRVETAFPLLLEMYQDYSEGLLSTDEFVKLVRLIESYVYRRYACDLPTNSLDKTFLTFSKSLRKSDYVRSFNKIMASFDSYRRFPSDNEFLDKIQIKELYSSNQIARCKYGLSKLEKYGWKEHVNLDNLTIEHVMPQTLDEQWKSYLGESYDEIYRIWLNRLGNLTLSGYNSEYQNYSFLTKRDMDGGYKDSAVHLNQSLAKENEWTESTMAARGKILAEKAIQVWPNHEISPLEIEALRIELNSPKVFTLDDYPNFTEGSLSRQLFDALHAALSYANVTCLKYYIALKYKGTNLVSINPSGNGLKCWLSLEYSELHDSSGFKDVKNIGHWGTGNVEFNLISQTQIESLLKEITHVKTKIEQQVSESKELTPYKIWQRNYWDEFRNYCLEKQFSMNPSATLRPAKPNSDYRLLTEVAHTVSYVAKLHDKKSLACGLIFKTKTHDLYEIALRHKTEVEQIFEDQILFQSYDKSDYLYIYGQSHGQLPDSDKTKEFEWYISSLAKFKEVLNKIKAKEWV